MRRLLWRNGSYFALKCGLHPSLLRLFHAAYDAIKRLLMAYLLMANVTINYGASQHKYWWIVVDLKHQKCVRSHSQKDVSGDAQHEANIPSIQGKRSVVMLYHLILIYGSITLALALDLIILLSFMSHNIVTSCGIQNRIVQHLTLTT